MEGFNAAGADTLTLDGSTRGGLGYGSIVYCRAAADGIWLINCALNGNGTMVTPWTIDKYFSKLLRELTILRRLNYGKCIGL